MKKLLITCSMAAAIAMPLAVTPTLSAQIPGLAIEVRDHERHPELHEALHALEKARHHLKEAKHDFGGHREAALMACDNAIFQLKLAIESDRR